MTFNDKGGIGLGIEKGWDGQSNGKNRLEWDKDGFRKGLG